MKTLILTVSMLGFLSGCGGKSVVKQDAFEKGKINVSTIGNAEQHEENIIIAILPFKNNTTDKTLDNIGITLADLITARMSTSTKFKLVERARMEEILNEIKLGYQGITNIGTAIRIGNMLGANVMGFGSYSYLGKNIFLNIRLVQVETGEIIGGASEQTDDISHLGVLANKIAAKIANSIQ